MRTLCSPARWIVALLYLCCSVGNATDVRIAQQKCSYQVDQEIAVEMTFYRRNDIYTPRVTAVVTNLSGTKDLNVFSVEQERLAWTVDVHSMGPNAVDLSKPHAPIEPSRMSNRENPLKMHRRNPTLTRIRPLQSHVDEIDLRNFVDDQKLLTITRETQLHVSVGVAGSFWRNFDAIEENRVNASVLSKARNVANCGVLKGIKVDWQRR